MHHYIYQVSLEPIPQACRLTTFYFEGRPDLFPIANSISDLTDCQRAISDFEEWLRKNKLGVLSGKQLVLDADARDRYFSGRYQSFQHAAKALSRITKEQFLQGSEAENLLSDVNSCFTDRYDDYFLMDWGHPIPADTFFRNALPGVPYYIGGVLDYQY